MFYGIYTLWRQELFITYQLHNEEQHTWNIQVMETAVWIRNSLQQRQRDTRQTILISDEDIDTEATSQTYGV